MLIHVQLLFPAASTNKTSCSVFNKLA